MKINPISQQQANFCAKGHIKGKILMTKVDSMNVGKNLNLYYNTNNLEYRDNIVKIYKPYLEKIVSETEFCDKEDYMQDLFLNLLESINAVKKSKAFRTQKIRLLMNKVEPQNDECILIRDIENRAVVSEEEISKNMFYELKEITDEIKCNGSEPTLKEKVVEYYLTKSDNLLDIAQYFDLTSERIRQLIARYIKQMQTILKIEPKSAGQKYTLG